MCGGGCRVEVAALVEGVGGVGRVMIIKLKLKGHAIEDKNYFKL